MRPLEKLGEAANVQQPEGAGSAEISSDATGAEFQMPNLGSNSAYAVTAKVAGRLNATAVSAEEHDALLNERQKLLDRKFEGTLSRAEENRLAYVRWSLDRIEDAKYGATLDVLEEHVARYENLLSEVTSFRAQLASQSGRRR
ncbi:hypothetical protein [Rhizobium sp. BR 362]|uniref:hypothetical protein n=1 Tax=Rhizobium sp. BR 362 TaxID=3040670 RepID=UPI002F41C347